MDDLLDFVLESHGALRRWPGVSALTAKLAVGWPFWRSSGSPARRKVQAPLDVRQRVQAYLATLAS
jgi:hypothetical protein